MKPTFSSMIEYILATLGFLIPIGTTETGSQFAERIRVGYQSEKAHSFAAFVSALPGRFRREGTSVTYTGTDVPELDPRPQNLDGLDESSMDMPTCDGHCTYGQWLRLVEITEDWRYLVIKAGGMATKSAQDEWLIDRYPFLTDSEAHDISNFVEMRGRRLYNKHGDELVWALSRPEPTYEQYGLDANTVPGKRPR